VVGRGVGAGGHLEVGGISSTQHGHGDAISRNGANADAGAGADAGADADAGAGAGAAFGSSGEWRELTGSCGALAAAYGRAEAGLL